jgi:large subunit ribosomal protein L15
MPIARRLPKLKGFRPPNRTEYGAVNVGDLADIGSKQVGPDEMRSAGLVHKRHKMVKVLGGGEISSALTVRANAVSATARTKIEEAGGSVELIESAKKWSRK